MNYFLILGLLLINPHGRAVVGDTPVDSPKSSCAVFAGRGSCSTTVIFDRFITSSHCIKEGDSVSVRCGTDMFNMTNIETIEGDVFVGKLNKVHTETDVNLPNSTVHLKKLAQRNECYTSGHGGDEGPSMSYFPETYSVKLPIDKKTKSGVSSKGSTIVKATPLIRRVLFNNKKQETYEDNGVEFLNRVWDVRNIVVIPHIGVEIVNGDSGGGLFCRDTDNKIYLVGITSQGNDKKTIAETLIETIGWLNSNPSCPTTAR